MREKSRFEEGWACMGVPYVEMGGSRLMAATGPCGLLGKGLMWSGRDVPLCSCWKVASWVRSSKRGDHVKGSHMEMGQCWDQA